MAHMRLGCIVPPTAQTNRQCGTPVPACLWGVVQRQPCIPPWPHGGMTAEPCIMRKAHTLRCRTFQTFAVPLESRATSWPLWADDRSAIGACMTRGGRMRRPDAENTSSEASCNAAATQPGPPARSVTGLCTHVAHSSRPRTVQVTCAAARLRALAVPRLEFAARMIRSGTVSGSGAAGESEVGISIEISYTEQPSCTSMQ